MKKLSNIELFNGITGKIFATLYLNFPKETEIKASAFLEDFIDPNDFDGSFDMPEMTKATLKWLDKAGYIWLTAPQYYGGEYSAILSPKGLEALKAVPDAIGKTIGEKILEFSKQKFSEGMNEIVKITISEGFKLILRP